MNTLSSAPRAENDSDIQLQHTGARRLMRWDVISIGLAVVAIAAYVLFYNFVLTRNHDGITVKGAFFKTEIMTTQQELTLGLSGRDHIDQDSVMVFKFGRAEQHCMWMKDMKFPIDMVWLDESQKVVAIEQNVSPDSYPTSFCHEGRQVLELAAGTAGRLSLRIGDEIQ